MTAMKKMLMALSVVLAHNGVAGATTTFSFESPTYTAGSSVDGQDSWAVLPAEVYVTTVIDTDATAGSQSVASPAGSALGMQRVLGETYTAAQTTYIKFDVKGRGYLDLLTATGGTPPVTGEGTIYQLEVGFDGTFQAYSPGNFTMEGSFPDTLRWVTVWAKLYDAGGGNRVADVGWNELFQAPFVAPRLTAFNAADGIIDGLQFIASPLLNPSGAMIDNVYISLNPPVVPEPPTSFAWANDAAGNWNTLSSWSPSIVPNGNTHTAVLGATITAPRTIFSDQNITLKTLNIDNASSYIVAGAGTLTFAADAGNAVIDVNQGTHQFQLNVALASSMGVDVAAGATLEFNNRLSLGGNTLTKTGTGVLNINNVQNAGSGSIVVLGGSVGGGGSIGGDLTNTSGTIAPGNSPGQLTVQDNFSQAAGGTLSIELAGLAAGTQYDQLAIAGSAALGGALNVSLPGGFTPAIGSQFEFLSAAGGVSGAFSSATLPSLTGANWQLIYQTNSVLLRVALLGDCNFNGVVDAADYTIWRDTLGQIGAGLLADVSGNGVVDQDDYGVWRANFGATAGAGAATGSASNAAVPEPSTLGMATLLGLALASVAARRARR